MVGLDVAHLAIRSVDQGRDVQCINPCYYLSGFFQFFVIVGQLCSKFNTRRLRKNASCYSEVFVVDFDGLSLFELVIVAIFERSWDYRLMLDCVNIFQVRRPSVKVFLLLIKVINAGSLTVCSSWIFLNIKLLRRLRSVPFSLLCQFFAMLRLRVYDARISSR
jgi:hypothetical protein